MGHLTFTMIKLILVGLHCCQTDKTLKHDSISRVEVRSGVILAASNLFLQGSYLLHHIWFPGNLVHLLRLGLFYFPGVQFGLQSLNITQFLLEISQFFGWICGDWLLSRLAVCDRG